MLLMMAAFSRRELKRLLHPKGVFPVKCGQQAVSESVIQSAWSYISVFVLVSAADLLDRRKVQRLVSIGAYCFTINFSVVTNFV